MTAPWRIEMLGGLAVVQGDRRISRFQTQKTGALLAFLALNPGKSHGREALAEMLWPEGDPLAIRNRLNQAISSLRRQLHPPELGPGSVLVTDHHSVGINSQMVVSDVEEFERAVRLAEKADSDEEKIRLLEVAVGLYKGELLEGYYEDWIFSRRMHVADLYDKALQQLIRSHVAMGDPAGAIEYARLRLAIDPYDEAPHVILMRLYMRAGRPKSALKQFEDLIRSLQSFDDEPSESAHKYKLKAEGMLENQVGEDDFEDDFAVAAVRKPSQPTSPAPNDVVSNLPRVVNSFVGREAELRTISDHFAGEKRRLVTILGLGGAGKTRLAIEVGWNLLASFQSKVFFVSLAALKDTEALMGEVARAMFPGKTDLADPMTAVACQLRELPRSLLILDNFEVLAEKGAGVQVAELLDKVPGLRILATSRSPLDVEDEVQVALAPLPLPNSDESNLKELAANPSVALFVDRAQVVKSDFQLTERTSAAIVDLIKKLEGMPLALELAAGWARVLTPSQMLEQVEENVDRLESRKRDTNARHRSLRAAFDGTFDLLDEQLRRVFLRMTTFAGGWDYAAAAHLCPNVDMVASMQALEERSLIGSQPSDEAVRFAMLDTVRAFGEGMMDPVEKKAIAISHSEYFLSLVERKSTTLEWVAEVERNYPNCVLALHRFRAAGKWGELARMAIALSRFWDARGMSAEGKEWLSPISEGGPGADSLTKARAMAAIARLEWVVGDFDAAVSQTRAALKVFAAENAVQDQIAAQLLLQHESHRRGDYEEARRLLVSNLELSQSIGDLSSEARCWLGLGNAAIEEERYEEAQRDYEKSLDSARRAGDHEMIGAALTNLANQASYRGHSEAAEKWIEESIAHFGRSRWKWYRAMNLIVKGRIENELGRFEDAARSLIEAYRIAPNEKLVVWRFLMLFTKTLFGLGLQKEGTRWAGYLDRFRERIGEHYHGLEMRKFESRLAEFRAQITPAEYAEQIEIGRNMSAEEIDGTISKVRRLFLSEV